MYKFYYSGVIGDYCLWEENEKLSRLWLGNRLYLADNNFEVKETPLLKEVKLQLDAYFAGKLKTFDLPLQLNGTPFQKKVWKSLSRIPYGEVVSYSQLAALINQPKAARAVGMANGKNPLPVIIPCHRVVGSKGKLTGYTGGLKIKEVLLALERGIKMEIS